MKPLYILPLFLAAACSSVPSGDTTLRVSTHDADAHPELVTALIDGIATWKAAGYPYAITAVVSDTYGGDTFSIGKATWGDCKLNARHPGCTQYGHIAVLETASMNTVLHELGHYCGLKHVKLKGAVMYQYYNPDNLEPLPIEVKAMHNLFPEGYLE